MDSTGVLYSQVLNRRDKKENENKKAQQMHSHEWHQPERSQVPNAKILLSSGMIVFVMSFTCILLLCILELASIACFVLLIYI